MKTSSFPQNLDTTRANKDFVKSQYCAPQFRSAPKRVQMVSPYTGQLVDFAGEQQWLAAGQGVLLKLE